MPNRRDSVHDYYRSVPGGGLLLEKAAASSLFAYHGPALEYSTVTRSDLNGYSNWARDRSPADRALMLDAFFSAVVPAIERAGGVFFRDEGDCIVALFSDYFARGASYHKVRLYCQEVTRQRYGSAQLAAKTCVACGNVAIFQKRHEVASGDWSAEGEPFVRAARLEAAIDSKQHFVFYEDDYRKHFAAVTTWAAPGTKAPWNYYNENVQVAGLGAVGGWTTVDRFEYEG